MIFEFHSHTNYADGKNTAEEMVAAALEKGLSVFGISEHHPRHPDFRYADDPPGSPRGLHEWPQYLAEMDELKKKYAGRLEVLKASEFDWLSIKHLPDWKKWRAESDFDYVIGSVHYLGKWGFDYLEDWEKGQRGFASIEEIYEKYYAHVVEMVESANDLFDIVGHLDLIKKFAKKAPANLLELALPALDAIARANLVLEVSSAGLRKPCADFYPNAEILRAARQRDIPITLTADAHAVAEIAANFSENKAFAKKAGYEKVVVFHAKGNRAEVALTQLD